MNAKPAIDLAYFSRLRGRSHLAPACPLPRQGDSSGDTHAHSMTTLVAEQ